ncbi:MAG TPA: transposase, partial [Methylomirabilota bacterium]|nr:transposase [Methylomirabilota bacterium]
MDQAFYLFPQQTASAVLHTWDQTLKDHFHLHCLMPAGALSFSESQSHDNTN